jgi:hypothetical protein
MKREIAILCFVFLISRANALLCPGGRKLVHVGYRRVTTMQVSPLSSQKDSSMSQPSYAEARFELQVLREKLDRMERQWSSLASLPVPSSLSEGSSAFALASSSVNALDARTAELCAMVAFFFIGNVLGASLFDRLGMVSGVFAAYWSSGAINHDTRAGSLVRNVGNKLARVLLYLKIKWNELVVFYKTGKLAFLGKAQYEKLDNRFAIEKRIAEFKRLSMMRIAELGQQEVQLADKVSDFLKVVRAKVQDQSVGKKVGSKRQKS